MMDNRVARCWFGRTVEEARSYKISGRFISRRSRREAVWLHSLAIRMFQNTISVKLGVVTLSTESPTFGRRRMKMYQKADLNIS